MYQPWPVKVGAFLCLFGVCLASLTGQKMLLHFLHFLQRYKSVR
nr:MAG TPA: hypothetical protein [Caudoviricetes sp.]